MTENIRNLEHKIRKKFGSISSATYQLIVGDFQRLVENGLRSEDDLPRMIFDSSLDPSSRASACWFLARLAPRRVSSPVLLRAFVESAAPVRGEAARSLGVIRNRKVLPTLIGLALYDPEPSVREFSVEALGLIQDRRALETLQFIAKNEDESLGLRGLAVEQLGRLGVSGPEVIETVKSLLQHKHAEISFWAIYALGELGNESEVPALEKVAEGDSRTLQPYGTLRDEALQSIETIRSRETLRRTTVPDQP
jgi:HEAT repeat protein